VSRSLALIFIEQVGDHLGKRENSNALEEVTENLLASGHEKGVIAHGTERGLSQEDRQARLPP